MHFQWYPGHMTKAKRMMQENIKLIDLVIELVDARLPVSSRNPDIDELGKNKARLILLNKADLAEEKWNDAWAEYFKKKGYSVVKVNSKRLASQLFCIENLIFNRTDKCQPKSHGLVFKLRPENTRRI